MTTPENNELSVLYCLRSTSYFPYHLSTLDALADRGLTIHLAIDAGWSRNRSTRFIDEWTQRRNQPKFRWLPVREGYVQTRLTFGIRELKSYASYLKRKDQSSYYTARWLSYLPKPVQFLFMSPLVGPISRRILQSTLCHSFFNTVERLTGVPDRIVNFVREIDPDILVASPTNLRYSNEVDYVKAASLLDIPTAVPVLTWDNLTTKGLIHIQPDLLLAWNETHEAEAFSVHGIERKRVVITGSPFFDKWFESKPTLRSTRHVFCERVGLDPNKPILLYLGSTHGIAADETWIVEKLRNALDARPEPELQDLQLLVRPHPANSDVFQRLKKTAKIAVWPDDDANKMKSVPTTNDELSDFWASVQYSIGVFGLNTSAMIDAVVMGRPVLSYLEDKYRTTQTDAIHYQQLLKSDVVLLADSLTDIVEKIKNLDPLWQQKRISVDAFIRSFIRPRGVSRPAGDVQAEEIVNLARLNKNANPSRGLSGKN